MKIYGVLVSIQEAQIKQHCLGDCGQAIIGALFDEQLGEILPCRTDVCPHLDRQMNEPIGTLASDGSELYIRKLK